MLKVAITMTVLVSELTTRQAKLVRWSHSQKTTLRVELYAVILHPLVLQLPRPSDKDKRRWRRR